MSLLLRIKQAAWKQRPTDQKWHTLIQKVTRPLT